MDTERLETLTFEKGNFVLKEVSDARQRTKLSKNAYWTSLGDDSYATTNLGAAAEYRKASDPRAEKIFQKTFQAHYPLPKFPPLPLLDPHQVEGIKWILKRKRSYLAHAPGAGKTAQAILAACLSTGKGQTVFIVPPSLTANWEREILKFTEWVNVFPAMSTVKTTKEKDNVAWSADFLIIPDSMLSAPWVHDRLRDMRIKLLAVDEASRFKDPWAERSMVFYGGYRKSNDPKIKSFSYPGIFRNAHHVVFLDGSPMPNRPIELYAPTFALHPEAIDCKTYDDFGYRYCGARPNERGVWEYLFSSHEDELKEKLQKDFMHVVPESALTHPERLRRMVIMSDDVRSREHREWERKNLGNYDRSWLQGEDLSRGDLAYFRSELGIRKIKWCADYVAERLHSSNESILLFAWHRAVVDGLGAALAAWNPGIIKGGTRSDERERGILDFQSGTRRLLILNVAAGGRGHNLQRADRVVFAEWSWTDEANRQCEKRASRKGSEKLSVPCEYLVCPNSLDEMVLSSLFTKAARVEKIVGRGASPALGETFKTPTFKVSYPDVYKDVFK